MTLDQTLGDFAANQLNLVHLRMDKQFHLLSSEGNLDHYIKHEISPGDDCRELLPVLYTVDPGDHVELTKLQINEGPVFDFHYSPGNLWLIGAQQAHDQEQISQQQANEQAILNNQLNIALDELKAAHRELKHTNIKLDRANAAKSQFIAGMSHEFRTPLSSVLGYASRMEQLYPHASELTQPVTRNAKYLLALVDNLLDQGRLDANELEAHPNTTDMHRFVGDLQLLFHPLAAEKQLTLRLRMGQNLPIHLYVDELRLRQIAVNLLGNAIKYTEQGSVEASLDWQDKHAVLTVHDTGPGIPQNSREKIFEPFEQVEGQDRKGGAGLGLALCREIAQRLGGDIELLTPPGKQLGGSCFRARLPATKTTTHIAKTEPSSSPAVLLVDDDEDVGMLAELYLEDAGFDVYRSTTIAHAIELANNTKPAAMILDMNLAEGSAVDAINQLRAAGFNAPWIALTASPTDADRQAAMAADCQHYLLKPVSPAELTSTILAELEKTDAIG